MSTAIITKLPASLSLSRAWAEAHKLQTQHDSAIEAHVALAEAEATQPQRHTPTVAILSALDSALSEIRANNPDVPEALAVVIATGGGKKHGHFAPSSWVDSAGEHEGSARHEILMSSESLARGAVATLTTLIHEAAHALSHATGQKDTARQGRYHNGTFEKVASGMGLVVEKNESIGYVTTGLQSWALIAYADTLDAMESVLISFRKPVEAKAKGAKTTIRVACECEVPVTVPIKWFEDFGMDNMTCALCIDAGSEGRFREFR